MDFSSVPRALDSLQRRNPPLDDKVLELSKQLMTTTTTSPSSSQPFCDQLTQLLQFQQQEQKEGGEGGKKDHNRRWEHLAVGLYVATDVLQQQIPRLEAKGSSSSNNGGGGGIVYMEGPRVPAVIETSVSDNISNDESSTNNKVTAVSSGWKSPELSDDQIMALAEVLHPLALQHLEDSEPRVRTLVAKAAGVYCKVTLLLKQGNDLRKSIHDRVVSSIQEHLAQGRATAEKDSQYSKSSTGALDDTTGWRALETNWQCLAAIISAMGPLYFDDFGVFSDQLLQDCQHSSIVHVNRHVRAAGMAVLEQCIAAAVRSPTHSATLLADTQSSFAQTMVAVLRDGLGDNWSQVRMAASVLCRSYLMALENLNADVTKLYPVLLPRMCLNRFYLAQGVKLYSHETWRLLFQNQKEASGIGHVVQNLPAVCRYYVKMCDADNHVVREAACQAIAELAIRLGGSEEYNPKFQPHVGMLLQALLMCFHDESWPVRDEACLACGILCRSYPEECRPELNTLWQRWSDQLTDQIWSVREDAAVALGDALEAYGNEFYQTKIKVLLKEFLPSAKKQPAMTMAEYKARQNDAAAHTDSQLFSCGSLAPKLHKRKEGAGRIGCSSCDITRERQQWEATDGCIYLVRELVTRCCQEDSVVKLSDAEIKEWLQELADVCRVRHFPQADDMRATLWRQLPVIAKALGKQRFKRNGFLEIFVDMLFANMDSHGSTASQLCQHAAGQCAEELAELMGVAIFRGRLEDDYQRELFDRVMQERRAMPKGPASIMDGGGGGSVFSPFGPPGLLDGVAAGGARK
ncbi:hypothetical protein ACA910_012671 [Epithemia clementina (nom. ined.)]